MELIFDHIAGIDIREYKAGDSYVVSRWIPKSNGTELSQNGARFPSKILKTGHLEILIIREGKSKSINRVFMNDRYGNRERLNCNYSNDSCKIVQYVEDACDLDEFTISFSITDYLSDKTYNIGIQSYYSKYRSNPLSRMIEMKPRNVIRIPIRKSPVCR
jgi:hypothetical protein